MSLDGEDDKELVRRLRAGDEAAWSALYRRSQGRIYRFALHMSGSVEMAAETTQETFVTFLGQMDRYDPSRGALDAWLLGIARRKMLRAFGRREHEEPLDEHTAPDNPLEEIAREQSVEAVRAAVLALPAPFREAIVLCELQELSYDEAARVAECPVGTIRSRLSRGRRMLAARLAAKAAPK